MANLRSQLLGAIQFLMLVQTLTQVLCYQHKVGNLDAWGIPISSNPQVYTKWSEYQTFKIGDSLLFLYPPSQDSVIQVTKQAYNICNITDPILYMNNGNSLFNITTNGELYFTSGQPGHCEKKQKLYISVLSGNGSAYSPSYGPSALPDTAAPSYPTVFGTIPAGPSSPSSSSPSQTFSFFITAIIGSAIFGLVNGIM